MNLREREEDGRFRIEARAWLDGHARRKSDDEIRDGLAELMSEAGDSPELLRRSREWQRRLADGGWAAITWPKEYGGREATASQAFIWSQELSGYDVPPNVSSIGIGLVGPTLIAHGSEEQKRRYLSPLASGEEIWCQLWSEPDAGSDLGSLRTRAESDAATGDWIVNGQKVWTSGAHYSDFGLMLARTDSEAPKHRGITCFIVDMCTPGVTPRPLRQMSGGAHFNEVFFEDVCVPKENVVGSVNDGWRVAITTLMHERFNAGVDLGTPIESLIRLFRSAGMASGPANNDPIVRQEAADLYVRARLLALTGYRAVTKISKGEDPGAEGSTLKLVWAQLITDIAALATRILGPASVQLGKEAVEGGMWGLNYLYAPGVHIGGGTDEVQRNTVGERVLGLPKEPLSRQSGG